MLKKYKVCILRNSEVVDEHFLWINACKDFSPKVEYDVVDLTKFDWFESISKESYDILLAKPPGLAAALKNIYDERISIIDAVTTIPIYPSPTEIYLYENKRFLYSWLKAKTLPHPRTYVFYNKSEAIDFISDSSFPLVAKTNIGASGSGVELLQNFSSAKRYISNAFSRSGAARRWGPNLAKGKLLKRGFRYLTNPKSIAHKMKVYEAARAEIQKGFVLLQEYIMHDFEWRVVVIGDSYFAHKKLKKGDKASGSTEKLYDNPPLKLFDFARKVMLENNFTSQALDLFETPDGKLLINELQCIFGQSDPYQMLVDGKPGRYRYLNDRWFFEEGDFNKNKSYNLRLEHALSFIEKK